MKNSIEKILIDGNSLTLENISAIAGGAEIVLSQSTRHRINRARGFVNELVQNETPVYGINTGFGYFSNKKISKCQLKQLQLNLIKSHASGYGNPLTIPETRLAMSLRLNVLLKGYTGVRFSLCEALHKLIQAKIYPIIPEYGSVGASGDLAPLAHLALPLIGEGLVHFNGMIVTAKEALKASKLTPFKLKEKEGLGLINGTQIMLAVGSLALVEALQVLEKAELITALSYEGLIGNTNALHPLIHEVRGQIGQKKSAHQILEALTGSYLFHPKTKRTRIQDPYSIRCAPQVHGASRDALNYTVQIIENELNGATDNPLIFTEQQLVLSGGNFHGQPLALAFDIAAMAVAELGNISERRLELFLNPHLSGLNAFLASNEGINSGYMAMQYLSASLVNENKLLSNPACTDSIPGNVGIEDHVSMGMTSARKLKRLIQNVKVILSIEMLAASQAIDLRKLKPLGKKTEKLYRTLRKKVPPLTEDRIIANDVQESVNVFEKITIENLLRKNS